VFPAGAALWVYRESPQAFVGDDDSLPVPAQQSFPNEEAAAPVLVPPPPPPPPATVPPADSSTAAASAARLPPRAPKAAGRGADAAALVAPVRVGGEIREPRKTRNVNPVYPREAVASRIQGVVILECTISPQGKVVAVKTLRSVAPMLDESAITAVKQWEYTPTLLNGVAVPVIMTVTVNFKLS
jgi:periplasmic protein TonB